MSEPQPGAEKALITGTSSMQPPGDTSGGALVTPAYAPAQTPRFPLPVVRYDCGNGHTHENPDEAIRCGAGLKAGAPDDGMLIFGGSPVKALGDGRIGGYLVTFGGDGDRSLYRDIFDASTDFIAPQPQQLPVMFFHGGTKAYGKKCLGIGNTVRDDAGIRIEATLNDPVLYAKAERGELAWSNGGAAHAIERVPLSSGAHYVKTWLMSEASVAPKEAVMDPRNGCTALKAMLGEDPDHFLTSEPAPRSLAERTEQWLDMGEDLLVGYRQVQAAQVKAGRPMSAARMERLKAAHMSIGDILAECTPQEMAEGADTPETEDDAPGMGGDMPDPPGAQLDRELLRLKMRATILKRKQDGAYAA